MRKIINIAMLAAVVAGAAVSAQAADITVNMYGASAQRDYWHSLGETFMTTAVADGGMGCATAHRAQLDSNFRVVKGNNCEYAGKTDPLQTEYDDIYITYGSVASLEGVRAAKDVAPLDASLNTGCAVNERLIVDVDNCTLTSPWATVGSCTGSKVCKDIQLGTSDVEGQSFTQKSKGAKFGHAGGTVLDIVLTPEDTTGLDNYKPTVVPFAFYANKASFATTAPGIDNLTRTQILNLFSGKIKNWNKLVGLTSAGTPVAFNSSGVQLCFRHAGSGTHASIDTAVMRGDMSLKTDQAVAPAGMGASAYFYQSSSSTKTGEAGMQQCIETNAGRTGFTAIGYMDADAASSSMTQLKYQGSIPGILGDAASSAQIKNGSYDFWSQQNVYVQPDDNTDFVVDMMTFAAANIPADKVGVWVPSSSLQVKKDKDSSTPAMK